MRRSTTAVPSSAVPLWMRPASVATKGRARRSARGAAAGRVGGEKAASTAVGVPARRAQPGASGPSGSQTTSASAATTAAALPPIRSAGGTASEARRAPSATSTAPTQRDREREHPRRLGVGAGAEPVHQRDRPARVGEPVQTAPRAVAEPPADEARDRQRDQQVGGDGAEAEPQRAIVRLERDDRVDDRDGRERVEQRRADVDGEQRDRQQRHGPVHRRDREAGRAARSPGPDLADPEHDARRQQHQRHRTGAARRVPERRRTVRGHAAASSRGQPATVCVRPS